MTIRELQQQIRLKQSFLCIGLDSDLEKIPQHLLKEKDPVFTFNKMIIDATHDLCVAYKPNLAFYEKEGTKGWESLKKTVEYIPKEIFTIGDAKRGDIGNTASMYASAFFDELGFDAITVAPYMGQDSVKPFLLHDQKWTILLGLTSNKGSEDFQLTINKKGQYLFETVMEKATEWAEPEKLMFVVGATNGEWIKRARKAAPNYFFLVPGIGAQGGSLKEVIDYAFTDNCGLLVNSSRGIIYAGNGQDFAEEARKAAKEIQLDMASAVKSAKGL